MHSLPTRLILVHMAELLQPENGIHQVPQAVRPRLLVRLLVVVYACPSAAVLVAGYVRTSVGR